MKPILETAAEAKKTVKNIDYIVLNCISDVSKEKLPDSDLLSRAINANIDQLCREIAESRERIKSLEELR